jgi:hypothetical protein
MKSKKTKISLINPPVSFTMNKYFPMCSQLFLYAFLSFVFWFLGNSSFHISLYDLLYLGASFAFAVIFFLKLILVLFKSKPKGNFLNYLRIIFIIISFLSIILVAWNAMLIIIDAFIYFHTPPTIISFPTL